MKRASLRLFSMALMLSTACSAMLPGCGSGFSPGTAGDENPASCFDIKRFTVLHVAPFNGDNTICSIELDPPPGFEFVDSTGKRLPYHPHVLIKRSH